MGAQHEVKENSCASSTMAQTVQGRAPIHISMAAAVGRAGDH